MKLVKSLIIFFESGILMRTKQKLTGIFVLAAIGAIFMVAGLAEIPQSEAAKTIQYKVTITNITPGQPLTPPLLVTHTKNVGIFTTGEEASHELSQLAENGNFDPLVEKLSGMAGVGQVVTGEVPLVPANNPGETGFSHTETFMISTSPGTKFLSFASMLICTNDGFTGLDTLRLPSKKTTVYSVAYDARTEKNTEDFVDMVPPCQGLIGISSADPGTGMSNPLIAEEGIVIPHPGIVGGDDLLPEVHAWGDPVAKIIIERMNIDDDDE